MSTSFSEDPPSFEFWLFCDPSPFDGSTRRALFGGARLSRSGVGLLSITTSSLASASSSSCSRRRFWTLFAGSWWFEDGWWTTGPHPAMIAGVGATGNGGWLGE